MKYVSLRAGILGLLIVLIMIPLSSRAETQAPSSAWWNEGWKTPKPDPKAKVLPLISVQGNHFITANGETVLFRGVSIADPDKLISQGHWNKELFAAVKDMGANLVRIPVHPISWRIHGEKGSIALLDQAVDWCTDLGLYVIIDWHSIGNLKSGLYQDPMYITTQQETFQFWRLIAQHFKGNNTVAFYELFNEPTHGNGMLGSMSWSEWRRQLNEEMISIVRYWDKERIPLVAGFDWAYDLSALRSEPVNATGIGYVTHPYPWKRGQPWEPRWEENFGFASSQYPMIATEIGFDLKPGEVVDDQHYGNRITRFLESRGIGWVAWGFDPDWGPTLLKSFDGFKLTGTGEFFKDAMHRPVPPVCNKKDHADEQCKSDNDMVQHQIVSAPYTAHVFSAWAGKPLTATSNANSAQIQIQLASPTLNSQQWMIEPVAKMEYVRLKNVAFNTYLSVTGPAEGAAVVTYALNDSWGSEEWIIELLPDSKEVRFKNFWSGKYLAITDAGNSAAITLQSLNTGSAGQRWLIQ